jgi:hypothetical protein
MKRYLIICLIVLSCSTRNDYNDDKKHDSVSLSKTIAKKDFIELSYKNDSLIQNIIVKYKNRNVISFTLMTKNVLKNVESKLEGIATKDDDKPTDDNEDECEDGTAFFYRNWHYINHKSQIQFRIGDSTKYIRIFEFDCQKLHNPESPFETKGVFKRTDILY